MNTVLRYLLSTYRQLHVGILNIGSLSSTHPHEADLVYGGSKAATDAMTASFALALGPSGIRVNSINPGMVKTEG